MSIDEVHMMSLKINVFYLTKKSFQTQWRVKWKHRGIILINYKSYMSYT